jgi:mRNA-degrading endonuclease RelE of RelBE toxin-antitoxin system
MLTVRIHKNALKELDLMQPRIRDKVLDVCKKMAQDPFEGDVRPIKGVKGVFRKRVGDYRIAFTVDFKTNQKGLTKIEKVRAAVAR